MSRKNFILVGAILLVIGGVLLSLRQKPLVEEPILSSVPEENIPEPSEQPMRVRVTNSVSSFVELPPVEQSVQIITAGTDYEQRIRAAVYDLPENMGTQHSRELQTYLLTPQNGKDGDFRQHEYALRNYIMDALREQTDRLPETITTFVDVYENEQQGDVMRGYALQHLCSVYIDNARDLPSSEKERILNVFTEALKDTSGGTLAGTALIGLHEAARSDADFVSGKTVEAAAQQLLQSPDAGTLSKISAFQICGERNVAAVAPAARKTALDESADWVLRMSAVYALGQFGQTDGLEHLLDDNDSNVSHAARMALKKTQR